MYEAPPPYGGIGPVQTYPAGMAVQNAREDSAHLPTYEQAIKVGTFIRLCHTFMFQSKTD